MKRRALKLFVFLLAGAIINVGVAWGSHKWVRVTNFLIGKYDEVPRACVESLAAQLPKGTLVLRGTVRYQAFGRTIDMIDGNRPDPYLPDPTRRYSSREPDFRVRDFAAGWPLRSVHYFEITHGSKVQPLIGAHVIAGERLPARPFPAAFAINTTFYAFILWLIVVMPFAIRRRWRIKRGVCARCAYPVGTSKKCTECGAEC